MNEIADSIMDAAPTLFDELSEIPGADELRGHLERPLLENCHAIKDMIA